MEIFKMTPEEQALALIIICSPLIVAFLIVAQLLITGVDRVMKKLWERV